MFIVSTKNTKLFLKINYEVLDAFSRVYPTATNGIPLAMYYNSTTRFFNYTFEMNMTTVNQARLTTDIFVPQHLYPKSFTVNVSSNLQWTFDQDSSKVLVSLKTELLNKLKEGKLHLKRASSISTVEIRQI